MSRYRTVAGRSAGVLATAAAALLTASATLPGSAAHLEVDGGVLQVFVLDGPDNLPGPPDGVPPGPPDRLAPGPPDGVPGGAPEGLPGGRPDDVVAGPPVLEGPSPGSQRPPDEPTDEQHEPDDPPNESGPQPGDSDQPPTDPDPEQRQSEQDSEGDDAAARTAAPESEVWYENCAEAREADAGPLQADDPGYRLELDDDGDGRACEEGEGRS